MSDGFPKGREGNSGGDALATAEAAIRSRDATSLIRIYQENWEAFQGDAAQLNWFGVNLLRLGHPIESLPLLERAAQLNPDGRECWHNISSALVQMGREEDAVSAFSCGLKPYDGAIAQQNNIICDYELLVADYDGNSAHHLFSDSMIDFYSRISPARRLRKVLDLGCGTGLLATRLPASATTLWGVDLSPDMLRIAEGRKLYDRLIQGDLVTVMAGMTEPFDSVFSACVLYYFADLRPIFAQVARLMAPEGMFVFSVDPYGDEHEIGVTGPGEYCHSRRYLRSLAAEVGLEEKAIEIARHRGPPGFWCAFKKA